MNLIWDVPDSEGKRNVLRRARRMCDLTWSPARRVEENAQRFYTAVPGDAAPHGQIIGAAPYSSARVHNHFLGTDLPISVFLSAVRNPFADIYTRDLSDPEERCYNCCVVNAFLFYGTVCSAFANYAYRLPMHRSTHEWGNIPEMHRLEAQTVDALRLCDSVVTTREDGSTGGHVRLITGIARDAEGRVQQVEISEGVIPHTKCRLYTAEEVTKTLLGHEGTYVIFRFDGVDAVTDPADDPVYESPEVLLSMGAGAIIDAHDPVRLAVTCGDGTLVVEGRDGAKSVYYAACDVAKLPTEGFDGKTYRFWTAKSLPAGEYRVSVRHDGETASAGCFAVAAFPKIVPMVQGQSLPRVPYRLCTPEGEPLRADSPCLYEENGSLRQKVSLQADSGSHKITVQAAIVPKPEGIRLRLAAHFMDETGERLGLHPVDAPIYTYEAPAHTSIEVAFAGPGFCTPSFVSWKEEKECSYSQRLLTEAEIAAGRVTSELLWHDTDVTHVTVYFTYRGNRISMDPAPIVVL